MSAKWDWYVDNALSSFEMVDRRIKNARAYEKDEWSWLEPRINFMYTYMDYNTKRH